jgi:hypothetical protein
MLGEIGNVNSGLWRARRDGPHSRRLVYLEMGSYVLRGWNRMYWEIGLYVLEDPIVRTGRSACMLDGDVLGDGRRILGSDQQKHATGRWRRTRRRILGGDVLGEMGSNVYCRRRRTRRRDRKLAG